MALALDPSNASAHAGLIQYFADNGQWAELSAEIDRAVRDNPTNNLVLLEAALQLPYLGRPEEGVAMADLASHLDPQMPPGRRGMLIPAYFFSRKFERAIELSRSNSRRKQKQVGPSLSGRKLCLPRPRGGRGARQGRPHREKRRTGDGDMVQTTASCVHATTEQDLQREAFRKLGLSHISHRGGAP